MWCTKKVGSVFALLLLMNMSKVAFGWDGGVVKLNPTLEKANIYTPDVVLVRTSNAALPTIGEGYDLKTGRPTNTNCITEYGLKNIQLNDISSQIDQVIDKDSLLTKQNLSISAKANYAGYSGGASYEESIETSTSFNKTSLVLSATLHKYATVLAMKENNEVNGSKPKEIAPWLDFSKEAKELLGNENSKASFRSVCGDGFVRQIVYGTEFYSALELSEQDYSKKQSITASINFSTPGDVFSAEAKSSFSSALKQSKDTLSIQGYARGSGQGELPLDLESLRKIYAELPVTSKGAERPMYAVIHKYRTLKEAARIGYVFKEPHVRLELLSKSALRFKSLVEVLDEAISDYGKKVSQFLKVEHDLQRSNGELKKTRMRALNRYRELKEMVSNCLRDDAACFAYQADDFVSDVKLELGVRASAPIALSDVPDSIASQLEAYGKSDQSDGEKRVVAAFLRKLVYLNNILLPSQARCRALSECVDQNHLDYARNQIWVNQSLSAEVFKSAIKEGKVELLDTATAENLLTELDDEEKADVNVQALLENLALLETEVMAHEQ